MLILLQQANVIICNGRACLADYGMASLVTDSTFSMKPAMGIEGVEWWKAPEVLEDQILEGVSADVFAFAMLVVEVLTGQVPFAEIPQHKVLLDILDGRRPSKPAEVEERMWDLIQSCWNQDPDSRPKIGKVVEKLKELVNSPGKCAIPRGY